MLLEAGRKPEHVLLAVIVKGHDLGDLRRGIGQRSRLVKHHRIRLRNGLQEAATLNGDVIQTALAHR